MPHKHAQTTSYHSSTLECHQCNRTDQMSTDFYTVFCWNLRCLLLEEARDELLQLGSGGCLAVVEEILDGLGV